MSHSLGASLGFVVVGIVEKGLLGIAHAVGDGVVLGESREGGSRVGDHAAILNVAATDFDEVTSVGVTSSDELGNHSDF